MTNPSHKHENKPEIEILDIGLEEALKKVLQEIGERQLTESTLMKLVTLKVERNLDICDLTGLEYAENLEVLVIQFNQLSNLKSLQRLKKLRELDLQYNHIVSLEGIEGLIELEKLDISGNSITDLNPLEALTELKSLAIEENSITTLEPLQRLIKLETLNIKENGIQDLSPLKSLSKLKTLNVHSNRVATIEPLEYLSTLENLNLKQNQIMSIESLRKLKKLKRLTISDNNIEDVSSLGNLSMLSKRLYLRGNIRLMNNSLLKELYETIEDVDFTLKDSSKSRNRSNAIRNEDRKRNLLNEIKKNNAYIQDSKILVRKQLRMQLNPAAFFRATAHLYFMDLATGYLSIPKSWKQVGNLKTWIIGDFHTENIGFYGNREGQVVFGLNYYDEVAVAPFYIDLIRFGTSLMFVNESAPNFQLSKHEAKRMIGQFVIYYKEAVQDVDDDYVDIDLIRYTKETMSGFMGEVATEVSQTKQVQELSKWTKIINGERLFSKTANRLIETTELEKQEIETNWDSYLRSLPKEIVNDIGFDYFKIKDSARRLETDIGSLGYDRYYVLIEGKTKDLDDDIILDIKAQNTSAVDVASLHEEVKVSSHAKRTLQGIFALNNNPDCHFGMLQGANQSYLVKERSRFKKEIEAVDFKHVSDLDDFINIAAKVIAHAHIRSAKDAGNPDFLKHVQILFENEGVAFEESLSKSALHYYELVLDDYHIFKIAYDSGKL